jgi:hypothetical protein
LLHPDDAAMNGGTVLVTVSPSISGPALRLVFLFVTSATGRGRSEFGWHRCAPFF